jgi:hypothetical protein
MAEAAPLAFNVSVPSGGLQGRTRLEKPLHKWLDCTDESGRRLKYVLWGPGGVGKSTLELKFAAGQAERGGGWLWLVFRLSASSMEQDYAGLLDSMLGKIAGRAPSCAAEEVRGRVHELLQSPAWNRACLAVLYLASVFVCDMIVTSRHSSPQSHWPVGDRQNAPLRL